MAINDTVIKLATFNVLAPCWADTKYYPVNSLQYLDKDYRKKTIIDLLLNLTKTNDLIALQETQEDEFLYIKSVLAVVNFEGFNINHRDDYWCLYITENPPFVSNGVALFWNKKTINMLKIYGQNLTNDGNRCIMAFFENIKNTKLFRLMCVHLDSDTVGRNEFETKEIINIFNEFNIIKNTTDIIIGDLNFNTECPPYNKIFSDNNFKNVLKTVNKYEITYPYDILHMGNCIYNIIDHILIRNGIVVDGKVITFNVWDDAETDDDLINLLLQRTGSDHFVVIGAVT